MYDTTESTVGMLRSFVIDTASGPTFVHQAICPDIKKENVKMQVIVAN